MIAVDLWLVERLPDGTERSQPLSLRGLYNQPIPFYFDTLTEGTKTLDVFGDLANLAWEHGPPRSRSRREAG